MADPVAPTDADRDTFRDRLKAALVEAGTTAKSLEEALAVSRGTFTRIYNGKRQLDRDLLVRIAGELGAPPEVLVRGTAFAELLEPAPAAEAVQTADVIAGIDEVVDVEHTTRETVETSDAVEVEPIEVEPEVEVEPEPEAEVDAVEPEAAAPPREEAPENGSARRPRADGERADAGRKRRLIDVPVRAAVAIAGGLALVGGTLVALVRRK